MTKDIDKPNLPNLNIERDKVIDFVNSDIGDLSLQRGSPAIDAGDPDLDDDGEIIDPRTELMEKLIIYTKYRDAADMLQNLAAQRADHVPRQFVQEINFSEDNEIEHYLSDSSLYDLARLFKVAMDNRPVISQFELSREPIKLEKQKELIKKYFDGEGKIIFNSLIKILKSKMEIIVTFLAVLDLVKEGVCIIRQSDVFHQIELINLEMKS